MGSILHSGDICIIASAKMIEEQRKTQQMRKIIPGSNPSLTERQYKWIQEVVNSSNWTHKFLKTFLISPQRLL